MKHHQFTTPYGKPSLLPVCSALGATGLIARLAVAPNTTRVYPTKLLGRLVNRHREGQDLVRESGALSLLIDQVKVFGHLVQTLCS